MCCPHPQATCDQQLSHESSRAVKLESEIARAQAECADTTGALQAELDEIAALQAEISALEAAQQNKSKAADDSLQASLAW